MRFTLKSQRRNADGDKQDEDSLAEYLGGSFFETAGAQTSSEHIDGDKQQDTDQRQFRNIAVVYNCHQNHGNQGADSDDVIGPLHGGFAMAAIK